MVKSREEKLKFAFIIIFVFVVACIIGWCYEILFYRIDRGMFIKRGQGIGPFLPIYGFGALAIDVVCSKFKKNPVFVFFCEVCFLSASHPAGLLCFCGCQCCRFAEQIPQDFSRKSGSDFPRFGTPDASFLFSWMY